MDFDDFEVGDVPGWLADEAAKAWYRVRGLVKQSFVESAKLAVKARFPSHSPPDGLPYIARERDLDIGYRENVRQLRARLKAAWRTWSLAGTPAGIAEALQRAGYTVFNLYEQNNFGALKWWQFEPWLFKPFPWVDRYRDDGYWGDSGTWGDGGSWSGDLPAHELELLRSIFRRKGTHVEVTQIVIVHEGELWDADAPPGTWDDDADALWGDDVSYLAP